MRILVELFWHIVGLIGFCLFCLSLPFLVIWVICFHPDTDAAFFFTYAAFLFGGVGGMLWWALIRALRGHRCGLGGSLLVLFGTYVAEVLLLMTGIVRLP